MIDKPEKVYQTKPTAFQKKLENSESVDTLEEKNKPYEHSSFFDISRESIDRHAGYLVVGFA
ncbi:hypothetical protein [Chryseolinea serpens]|uniref:hypothetical protein n=1 Tax=Chryseolinea serpens TaxID=947013 RepID=UPI00093385F1|nr:hypothetical protein [Chryseolinea serpens]